MSYSDFGLYRFVCESVHTYLWLTVLSGYDCGYRCHHRHADCLHLLKR